MILTITADDYGYDPGIDRGIHECLRAGGIDNISVSYEVDFARFSSQDRDEMHRASLGIHWNLFPLEFDGTRGLEFFRLLPASLATRARKIEVLSKLDECYAGFEKVGLHPIFFNGHQHVHLLPWWLDSLVDWCLKRGVTIFRQPMEAGKTGRNGRRERPELMVLEFLGRLARRRTRHKRIRWLPSICRWGRVFELENLCEGLQEVTKPIIEGMVHPGFPTPEFERLTRWPLDHRKQAKELCRKDRDALFLEAGIKRVSLGEYLVQSVDLR